MADTMTLEEVRGQLSSWFGGSEACGDVKACDRLGEMINALDAATKQRGQDKRDAARLDWFDAHAYTIYKVRDVESGALFQHVTVVDDDRFPRLGQVHGTIREAIDAAMAGESGR